MSAPAGDDELWQDADQRAIWLDSPAYRLGSLEEAVSWALDPQRPRTADYLLDELREKFRKHRARCLEVGLDPGRDV